MISEKSTQQLKVAPQRSRGAASVTVQKIANQTRLEDLFQQGCAKIRLPKTYHSNQLETVMINTAGGLTGGDEIDWQFTSKTGSNLTVTSQACERIYQSSGGTAQIHVNLTAEGGSTLSWLPQETILFEGCAVHRKINVSMEGNSRVLLVEPLIFGRKAMKETITTCHFNEDWRVKHSGRMVHAESTFFDEDFEKQFQQNVVLNGQIAMATILLLAPSTASDLETKLASAKAIIGSNGGISLWEVGSTGKLLARLTAKDGYDLRKRLIPLITLLNDDAQLPKSWAI